MIGKDDTVMKADRKFHMKDMLKSTIDRSRRTIFFFIIQNMTSSEICILAQGFDIPNLDILKLKS